MTSLGESRPVCHLAGQECAFQLHGAMRTPALTRAALVSSTCPEQRQRVPSVKTPIHARRTLIVAIVSVILAIASAVTRAVATAATVAIGANIRGVASSRCLDVRGVSTTAGIAIDTEAPTSPAVSHLSSLICNRVTSPGIPRLTMSV